MQVAVSILVAFVALQHFGFLVLEMFLWDTPVGHQVFGLTPEFARESTVLAANQGLYNGFLAAGLVWSFFRSRDAVAVRIFFLSCVVVAGVFGGLTASPSIFLVQAAPAALALVAVWRSEASGPE